MIKINFYIHTLGGGGAEKALINMVNNMDPSVFDITVTTLIETGIYTSMLNDNIKRKTVLHIPGFLKRKITNDNGTLKKNSEKISIGTKIYTFFWKFLAWTLIPKSYFHNRHSDVVVSYLEGPTQIYVSKIPTKAKKIAWVHVDLSIEKKSEIFFKNKDTNAATYLKFDSIVTVSKRIKESLYSYIGLPKDTKIEVVHNAYDDNDINLRSNETVDYDFYDNGSEVKIVSVGRLSSQKGYDRLLKAVKEVKLEHSNFEILIVGIGEDFESLNEYIQSNNLSSNVRLLGYQQNPYPFIKNADVFFSSSRTEGFSTVVVESLILGTGIIATDCSGMDEILDNGIYGDIIENTDEAIYQALHNLVADNQVSIRLKDQAEKGQSIYTLKKQISNLETFFLSSLEQKVK